MVDALLLRAPAELLERRVSDPYPYVRRLRDHSPVLPERKRDGRTVWHVARYDDIRALLTDERLSKNPDLVPGYRPGPAGLNEHLVHADPPDHTRLRRLVGAAFLPPRITAPEPFVRRTAERLLDRVDPHHGRRRRPGDHDRPPRGPQRRRLRPLLADRRTNPREDLLSMFADADAEARGVVTEDEAPANCVLLLFAGHKTTARLISNGLGRVSWIMGPGLGARA